MVREGAGARSGVRRESFLQRVARTLVFGATLLFVLTALAVSAGLVVYTAWRHDLGRGIFALIFAVLSAQIAVNWLLWREDKDHPEESPFDPR